MTESRLTSLDAAIEFIQAGNARFTLRSVKTGGRFTYRVRTSSDGRVWFVSLLTGSDNENHYSYMGIIDQHGSFRSTSKSKVTPDALGYKAFDWTWRRLKDGVLPDEVEVWHEGRCGRCGRTLTVPESIERGIGPECAKRTGVKGEDPQLEILGV